MRDNPEAPRYMRAYFHTFTPTGVDAVDAILEAIAMAGKGFHHTGSWDDAEEYGECGYWTLIQQRANEAAAALAQQAATPTILSLPVGMKFYAAPPATPAPADEREAFEAWVMSASPFKNWSGPRPLEQHRDPPRYFYAHVECAWDAWQARAALEGQG